MAPLRRVSRQARSRRRFEEIVAAAARLVADAGFNATTMDGIAEAADTTIGSVYQFFTNKRSIVRAVAA